MSIVREMVSKRMVAVMSVHCIRCGTICNMLFEPGNTERKVNQRCGLCKGLFEKAPPECENPVLIRCEERA